MSLQEKSNAILPGATIGVFGGGQLGRMFSVAAKKLGYRVHVFSPLFDSPAGQVADLEIQALHDDANAIEAFARHVDVITVEFENIPVEALELASQYATIRPNQSALSIAQNRLREKYFLQSNGFPVGKFSPIQSLSELKLACTDLMPAVLKTAEFGYDGKGQAIISESNECEQAWNKLQSDELILEDFIEFDLEFSVIGARGPSGANAIYAPIENEHRNHILHLSSCPANITFDAAKTAKEIVADIMDHLDYVGVLCVEFFYCKDGRILVNEIAPRPHNSGHLTIEANQTSQFEQQVRAVCGLPLGSPAQIKPGVMMNLLGDFWNDGQPRWDLGLCVPSVSLHLYGKEIPSPGRKMGHLTSIGDSIEQAKDALSMFRTLCHRNRKGASKIAVLKSLANELIN